MQCVIYNNDIQILIHQGVINNEISIGFGIPEKQTTAPKVCEFRKQCQWSEWTEQFKKTKVFI